MQPCIPVEVLQLFASHLRVGAYWASVVCTQLPRVIDAAVERRVMKDHRVSPQHDNDLIFFPLLFGASEIVHY